MRHPFFIKVYARISPLGTGADFRRWFFVRHARRLTHWNGGLSVLSPQAGAVFQMPPSLPRGKSAIPSFEDYGKIYEKAAT